MPSEPRKDSKNTARNESDLLLKAARLFFAEGSVAVLEESQGYSGSAFARVESSSRRWIVRRWPAGLDVERLRFVHWVLIQSRAEGFEGVPRLASTDSGQTIVEIAGYLYDAQELLRGRPLSAQYQGNGPLPNVAAYLPGPRLLSLAESLARFHHSTSRLQPGPEREIGSLPERLRELTSEVDVRRVALLDGVRERAEGKEQETAQRWLGLLPRALSVAHEVSEKLLGGSRNAHVLCHADLWPAHVYFEGDAFVGFVDFESMVFASPALDLAQLIGHFGGWDAREDVLRAYERIAPLEERCRAGLPLEIVADLASEGLWSLRALYGEPLSRTTRAQREAHTLNLGMLLGCLEGASREAETVRG